MGLLDVPAKPQLSRIPVATRPNNYAQGLSSAAGSSTPVTYRRSHHVTVACTDLILYFGNWYNANGSHTAGPNQITVTASVVTPDGTIHPLYFRGLRSVTIDGGGVVASDSVSVELAAGTVLQTLTAVSVTTGNKWPVGIAADGNTTDSLLTIVGSPDGVHATSNEGDNSVAATGDVTMTPGNTTATNNVYGYSPQAIVGLPTPGSVPPKTWVIAGDSWTVGGGDAGHDWGWVVRWLNNAYGHFHIGAGNSNAADLVGSAGRARLIPMEAGRTTHGVLAHGTNDRAGSAPQVAAFQANLILEAKRLAARKIKVWVPTIGPRTTSTDAWVTTMNQTPIANETARVGWNAWIRAGLPIDPTAKTPVAVGTTGALLAGQVGHYVQGYLEIADVLESARDSGIWKAGYTADGVHPKNTSHAAIVTALPAISTISV